MGKVLTKGEIYFNWERERWEWNNDGFNRERGEEKERGMNREVGKRIIGNNERRRNRGVEIVIGKK